MQPPPPLTGPARTIPKTFRRITGAHAIIASLVLADLFGFVIWLGIGTMAGPPLWYVVRALAHLFHASLFLDLWLIAMIVCISIGRYRRHSLHMPREEAWGGLSVFMVISGAVILVIWLVKSDWMAIPAGIIPAVPLESLSFKLVLVPQGAEVLAALSLLIHLYVLRRARTDPAAHHLSLSRAHPGGQIWNLIEQAYALYRQGLARFNPPPIRQLRTPPTIYYYQRQTEPDSPEPPNPEQELYWRDGHLVINRAWIGPKDEQADILLPQVARRLYDCNTPDRIVEQLFHLAHVALRSWIAQWLLAVPLSVQLKCEQRWEALERERVLDRDWFAYACDQGPRLRKWLRMQLKDRGDLDLPDNAIPTLAERIDHLDSLLNREEQQLQRLRDMLPPASAAAP
jgi:hypothetical protein